MVQSRQKQLPGARVSPALGPKRGAGNDNRKKPPFKKRLIRPGDPLFPPVKRQNIPFGKGVKKPKAIPLGGLPFGKYLPWAGVAATAASWYMLSQNAPVNLADYGWKKACSVHPNPPEMYAFYRRAYGWGLPSVCGVPEQPYSWGAPTPAADFVIPARNATQDPNTVYTENIVFWFPSLNRDRGTMVTLWSRRLDRGAYAPAQPYYESKNSPYMIPPSPEFWPDPFSPYNVPRPALDPLPASPPWASLPYVHPPGRHVPSIDLTPDGVKIGWHEKRPPRKDEREKKKRLGSKNSAAWVSKLQGWIGGFTESDDFMSALYKGLHWKVRRWRGRDGVWRDRDITSFTRAKRLGRQLGDLSIEKAITEIVKENATDWAYGKTSKKITDNFKKSGLQFPHGLTSQRNSGSWEEVYGVNLRKQQGAKVNPVRYIYKNEYDPAAMFW